MFIQQEIKYALESAIVTYLQSQVTVSGSLLSGSNALFLTGINNVDKESAPFVIVDCFQQTEQPFMSRNFELMTRIQVQEIAADTVALGILGGAVFNEFMYSPSASYNITQTSLSSSASHVSVWHVQQTGGTPSVGGDALLNECEYRIIGALVP